MTAESPGRRPTWVVHGLAGALILAGVVAQFTGASAPDLGQPPPASDAFDAAYLARAAAYRRPLYVVGAAVMVLRLAVAAAFALTPLGRRATAAVVDRIGRTRPARAAAGVITGIVVATDVVVLPLEFWAGYIHDGRFGLRSQGLAGWSYDWAVVHAPVWLGVALATLAGYWLARRLPRLWAPVGGIGVGLVTGVVVFVSPFVLEPLLYRFEPLERGPVRSEVEQVLQRAGEDVDAILVADASRRSPRQNAYISGFGASERVVLFDTLVDQRPPPEVGVVVAHELAHKRNGDVVRYTLLTVAAAGLAAYLLFAVVRWRTRRGLQRDAADPSAAAVVLLTVAVLAAVAMPVQSYLSRRTEAAADLASLQFTDAPDTFTRMHVGLARTNLSEPLPPRLVSWYWGTHPPAMARLAMAQWWEQR